MPAWRLAVALLQRFTYRVRPGTPKVEEVNNSERCGVDQMGTGSRGDDVRSI